MIGTWGYFWIGYYVTQSSLLTLDTSLQALTSGVQEGPSIHQLPLSYQDYHQHDLP